MSDSNKTSNRGTNTRKSHRPRKGKDQAEREELSLTRSLREGTASAPAAPGCQENRPSEAEATHEGESSKPKRHPADRGQSRLGEPGSRLRPGVHKGERGTPGKRAQAAAGRKAEQPTEAPTPAGRKEGRVRKTTPDPQQGTVKNPGES